MSELENIEKCFLRVTIPGQEPADRTISYFPCSVGRTEDNDLVIRDNSVSSHHAVLRIGEGGGLYLEDLGSTNGTFCDGVLRERVLISKPVRLLLGDVTVDVALTADGLNRLSGGNDATEQMPSNKVNVPPAKPAVAPQGGGSSQAGAVPTATRGTGAKTIICPHCWHSFDVGEFLFIARHQSLIGDAVLGADAQQRFLPSRFTPEGNAIDAAGMSCPDMACPRCHLRIPQAASEMPPLFLSIVGATASGKSYFLTSMTWELRNTLSRNFAISFTDTDAVNNQILNDFEETIFLASDSEELVALRKTELQGELYNQVLLDNMLINLPKPFMFTVMPAEHHPKYAQIVKSMSRTLVLYDNAGEHFEPGMDSVDNPTTKHLLHSDTIFFLFDPTKDV
ncbi:MAG: FHA domain-containing protein, partial [Victivallales bacterium]|nr:FHA domain-containing protein [Victivallales bacterium]